MQRINQCCRLTGSTEASGFSVLLTEKNRNLTEKPTRKPITDDPDFNHNHKTKLSSSEKKFKFDNLRFWLPSKMTSIYLKFLVRHNSKVMFFFCVFVCEGKRRTTNKYVARCCFTLCVATF